MKKKINKDEILIYNKGLKKEKEVDAVYCNYLDRYHVLAKRIIEISKDKEHLSIQELYLYKFDKVEEPLLLFQLYILIVFLF